MKRIMILIAVVAAILASCSKSEPEAGNSNARIKLNLSVSNINSDESKALIKNKWVKDDELLIWFDSSVGETPDMVIKFNGSKWEQDVSASTSGNMPSASGNMKVLYNNILIITAKDPYNFADNTLSGTIQTWEFLTEIQVVVSGLNKDDAGKYSLSCDKFTPLTGFTVGADDITAIAGEAGSAVKGISNTDGAAFVFASSSTYNNIKPANFSFTLYDWASSNTSCAATISEPEYVVMAGLKWAKWNLGASEPKGDGYYFFWGGTEGYVFSLEKSYSIQKTLNKDVTKIKAIKIASTSFKAGSKKSWINAQDGSTRMGFYWSYTPFNGGINVYNESYFESVRENVCPGGTLAMQYDAANKYLGGNWRMPSKEDFDLLVSACGNTKKTANAVDVTEKGIYQCNNYESGDGKKNLLFCDGTNKLCFPFAGYSEANSIKDPGNYLYIWLRSLDPNSNNSAFSMAYTNGLTLPSSVQRNFGMPIRPVANL